MQASTLLRQWAIPVILGSALVASGIGGLGFAAARRRGLRTDIGPPLQADGLTLAWQLLEPAKFGVGKWAVGDYATYAYSRAGGAMSHDGPRMADVVRFQIQGAVVERSDHGRPLRPSGLQGDQYWLLSRGTSMWRDLIGTYASRVTPQSLWCTSDTPSFGSFPGYFPLRFENREVMIPPKLEWVIKHKETFVFGDREVVGTQMFAALPGRSEPLEVLASGEVSPLGVLRVRLGSDELRLVDCGNATPEPQERHWEALVSDRARFDGSCAVCHVGGNPHERVEWLR